MADTQRYVVTLPTGVPTTLKLTAEEARQYPDAEAVNPPAAPASAPAKRTRKAK